jgi:hypothetical protein
MSAATETNREIFMIGAGTSSYVAEEAGKEIAGRKIDNRNRRGYNTC